MVVSLAVGWAEIERGREPDWDAARAHVGALSEEDLRRVLLALGRPGADAVQLREQFVELVDWCEAGWSGEDWSFQRGTLRGSSILIGTGDALAALMVLHQSGAGEAAGFWRPEFQLRG